MVNVNTVNETSGLENRSTERTYGKTIWSTAKYAIRLQLRKATYKKIFLYDEYITLLKNASNFFVLRTKSPKDEGGPQVELSAMWVLAFVCGLNWDCTLATVVQA